MLNSFQNSLLFMNNSLHLALKAALKAGEEILHVYQSDIAVELKQDHSPLTEADKRSHWVIKEMVSKTGIPLLSEEGKQIPYEQRKHWDRFWLIDPLDGTKEFIKRNGEFTVNIALIEKGTPVMGVVYVPVEKCLYFGTKEIGSYKYEFAGDENLMDDWKTFLSRAENLNEKSFPKEYTIVASRSHLSPETEKFIEAKKQKYGDIEIVSAGSSLKLCFVAEGKANVYPRLAPTMEWDTAAGHAVARFAQCKVYDFESGHELHYNKEDLHNPWFVVEKQ